MILVHLPGTWNVDACKSSVLTTGCPHPLIPLKVPEESAQYWLPLALLPTSTEGQSTQATQRKRCWGEQGSPSEPPALPFPSSSHLSCFFRVHGFQCSRVCFKVSPASCWLTSTLPCSSFCFFLKLPPKLFFSQCICLRWVVWLNWFKVWVINLKSFQKYLPTNLGSEGCWLVIAWYVQVWGQGEKGSLYCFWKWRGGYRVWNFSHEPLGTPEPTALRRPAQETTL